MSISLIRPVSSPMSIICVTICGNIPLADRGALMRWPSRTLARASSTAFAITTLPAILWISGAVLIAIALVLLFFHRRGFLAAGLALVIGACLGGGITYGVTDASNPDSSLDLKNVVSSTNVDYGLR